MDDSKKQNRSDWWLLILVLAVLLPLPSPILILLLIPIIAVLELRGLI